MEFRVEKRSCNNFSQMPVREAVAMRIEYQKYQDEQAVEWRTIPGFPDYEISSTSQIRHRKSYYGRTKTLLQTIRNNRYFYVTLTSPNGNRVGMPVDKLMAITYLNQNLNRYQRIHHLDMVLHNNQIENLLIAE